MTRALALGLLLASACSTSDLCGGYDGACIGITVTGTAMVNQLSYELILNGGAPHSAQSSTSKTLLTLPVTTALHPSSKLRGDMTLNVTGWLDGSSVGTGEVQIHDFEGNHIEVTVMLEPPDAGVLPDAGGDLAGGGGTDGSFVLNADMGHPDMTYDPCPAAADVFCDSFDMAPSTVMCPADVGSVTTGMATPEWMGPYLDVEINAGESTQMCVISEDVSASSGDLWVRFYVESDAKPDKQIEILEFTSNAPNLGLGISNTGNTIVWTGFGVAANSGTPALFVSGHWTCIEAHVDFANAFTVYVDGQVTFMSLASTSGGSYNPITQLVLGIFAANDGGMYDFHFDDLAIGTTSQRIGCEWR